MQRTRSLSGRALRPEQLFGDRYGQRSDRSPKSFGNADEPRDRHFGCVEKTSAILLLKQNRLKGCTASLSLFALLHLWTLYPFASPPAPLPLYHFALYLVALCLQATINSHDACEFPCGNPDGTASWSGQITGSQSVRKRSMWKHVN